MTPEKLLETATLAELCKDREAARDEADKYGSGVSTDVKKKFVDGLFTMLDTDGKGALHMGELEAFFDADDAKVFFDVIDTNSDDNVKKSEFKAFMDVVLQDNSPLVEEDAPLLSTKQLLRFIKIVQIGLHSRGTLDSEAVGELFEELDVTGGGQIDINELTELIGDHANGFIECFDSITQNGMISREEFVQWSAEEGSSEKLKEEVEQVCQRAFGMVTESLVEIAKMIRTYEETGVPLISRPTTFTQKATAALHNAEKNVEVFAHRAYVKASPYVDRARAATKSAEEKVAPLMAEAGHKAKEGAVIATTKVSKAAVTAGHEMAVAMKKAQIYIHPTQKQKLKTVFDKICGENKETFHYINLVKIVKNRDTTLQNMCEEMGITTASLMQIFHEMDANKSGDIDWEEFQGYVGLAIKRQRDKTKSKTPVKDNVLASIHFLSSKIRGKK